MRYGLSLPIGGECGDPYFLAELAALAEASGWDGVFLEDYIVYQSQNVPTCDPWVTLAAMALSTKRIRLGTMITPLSRRRPWKVARETVTLDHLSKGRLILGIGVGDVGEPGFAQVGEAIEVRQRARMLDEALDVLVGCWSGEPFSYEGEHYHIRDMTLLPKPVQTPRIPVWVGGAWPNKGAVRRAARWDGACFYKQPEGDQWQDMLADDIRALRTAVKSLQATPAPFDIAVGGRERREDWEQERVHIRSVAEAGATWWSEWVAPAGRKAMRAVVERGPLRVD
jgi:alkanesulfonate monooxygenase SsuD/methylene tetrahydromethanopterin reductase-like flavin-dependent oxidoreductase (luciferase family)